MRRAWSFRFVDSQCRTSREKKHQPNYSHKGSTIPLFSQIPYTVCEGSILAFLRPRCKRLQTEVVVLKGMVIGAGFSIDSCTESDGGSLQDEQISTSR